MDNEQARILLKKYNSGQCTEAEKALVEKSFFAFNEQDIEVSFDRLKVLKKQISKKLPKSKAKISLNTSIAISSVAAVIALAIYLYTPQPINELDNSMRLAGRIFPRGRAALIRFSNGKTIELNKTKSEVKVNGSVLSYGDGSMVVSGISMESQTISTPNGGEFKIVLSDGTKVWLNAATILQYPSSFGERTERRVRLVSGEAYFEVAKDKSRPFIVVSGTQNLTVLGTHFNLNSYGANIRTTLLEGSVKLKSRNGAASTILLPGEESINIGTQFQKARADLDVSMAWRNGKIKFRNESLGAILREAERWYNIKVEYEHEMPNIRLTGGISRKSSLATLLKLLQLSGVTFTLREDHNVQILKIS